GVAPSPGVAVEGPADLVARPALRPPRAGLADVAAAGLLDDREHREALQGPCTGHLQEATPRRGARQLPADEARGFLVAQHLRVAIEVLHARVAQQQAFGFDADVGGIHAGIVRITEVVICRSGGSLELLLLPVLYRKARGFRRSYKCGAAASECVDAGQLAA